MRILILLALCALAWANGRPKPNTDKFWWEFSEMDCSDDDITSFQCKGMTVDDCKSACLQTPGCGGFNTNGFLKKTTCNEKKSDCPGCNVNLFVLQPTAQPIPPTPSVPAWESAWPPIVPHPSMFKNGSDEVLLNSKIKLVYANASTDVLQRAVRRFQKTVFTRRATSPHTTLARIIINVANGSEEIQLEMDESYQLDIAATQVQEIVVTANTQVGAMRGLETLSQLIRYDVVRQLYVIQNAPWLIDDAPRFKHRELLVDSSRHYLPVKTIMRMLDSMAYAKINVLHWHIVDEQSFPFRGPSLPRLADFGAYSPYERYSIEDVEDVVEFAKERGIRVVVEIDNPGHARSWCAGIPEICPSATCLTPLNPTTNKTFDVIEAVLKDLTGGKRGSGVVFDNMFHLGGDEVDTSCWDNTPEIAEWMKSKNMTAKDTYLYFVARAQEIGKKMGRDVVGWEEIWNYFGTKLDKSTIVQVWLDKNTVKSVVEAGYRALFSPYPIWYLDYLNENWKDNYLLEPCDGLDDDKCDLVMGGGGEMWGETVDGSDIQQTVWPRLAAIAERLWSPRHINDTTTAEPRMHNFRCVLLERGVAAAPLNNPTARSAPTSTNSCWVL